MKTETATYKVLLIEDNPLAHKVAMYALKLCHCAVDAVKTGGEALQALYSNTYDLVLMDLGLPDRDGLTVTETIRLESEDEAVRNIPIIAVTAHTESTIREQAKQAGITDFHVKPITTEAIRHWLATYVARDEDEKVQV